MRLEHSYLPSTPPRSTFHSRATKLTPGSAKMSSFRDSPEKPLRLVACMPFYMSQLKHFYPLPGPQNQKGRGAKVHAGRSRLAGITSAKRITQRCPDGMATCAVIPRGLSSNDESGEISPLTQLGAQKSITDDVAWRVAQDPASNDNTELTNCYLPVHLRIYELSDKQKDLHKCH